VGAEEKLVVHFLLGEFLHGVARTLEHSLRSLGSDDGMHAGLGPDPSMRVLDLSLD